MSHLILKCNSVTKKLVQSSIEIISFRVSSKELKHFNLSDLLSGEDLFVRGENADLVMKLSHSLFTLSCYPCKVHLGKLMSMSMILAFMANQSRLELLTGKPVASRVGQVTYPTGVVNGAPTVQHTDHLKDEFLMDLKVISQRYYTLT